MSSPYIVKGPEPARSEVKAFMRRPNVAAELRRVEALFHARRLAMIIGAPMPKPEDFKS
jgi:hypothetical protein